jgi:tetratricopeptide (TPR) repeat protein
LWENGPPPTGGRNQIHGLVKGIRKKLAGSKATGPEATGLKVIETLSERGYRLNSPPATVDLLRFNQEVSEGEQALREGSLAESANRLRAALRLWRGRALEGVDGRFAENAATRLEERRRQVRKRRMDISLRLGQAEEIVAELMQMVHENPWDEAFPLQLMLALVGSGRSAQALTEYEKFRQALDAELDVPPGTDLTKAYHAIRSGASIEQLLETFVSLPAAGSVMTPPPGDTLTPCQLPADDPNFVGRSNEIEKLNRGLPTTQAEPTAGAAAIVGPAGVGKTALALHWAHRVRDQFPDGQLYVDLCGYSSRQQMHPVEALRLMLYALGIPHDDSHHDEDVLVGEYRSQLDGKRMLILLDNAANADQVRPLLPGSPGCLAVVTSRNTLSGLSVRHGVRSVELKVLSVGESMALLRRVVGTSPVDREPDAAAQLVRQCARLPLALRIMAERAAHHPRLPLADLTTQLDGTHRLDTLATPDGDDTAAVRPVLSWSYRNLPVGAAHMFRLLGLHAGPDISIPAVASLADVTLQKAGQTLDTLKNYYLLDDHQGRYRFHDLLRFYAHECSTEVNGRDCEAAITRELTWYLHTAAAADKLLLPRTFRVTLSGSESPTVQPLSFTDRQCALEWCVKERINLVAAVQQAFDHRMDDIAWRIPAALWGFFYLYKPWKAWFATGRIALDAARRLGDRYGEAWSFHSLGTAYWSVRAYGDATSHHRQALAIWREIEERWGEAVTLNNLAVAYAEQRLTEDATACFQQALEIRREIGDKRGQAQTLSNLGKFHREQGNPDKSTAFFQQALKLQRALDEQYGMGATLGNLAGIYVDVQKFQLAIKYYQKAVTVMREIGDRQGVAETLHNLGNAQRCDQQPDAARKSLKRAAALFKYLGDSAKANEVIEALTELCKPTTEATRRERELDSPNNSET